MFFDLVICYSYQLVILCPHLHCINYHLGHPPLDPPLDHRKLHSDNLNCKKSIFRLTDYDVVVNACSILTNLF